MGFFIRDKSRFVFVQIGFVGVKNFFSFLDLLR